MDATRTDVADGPADSLSRYFRLSPALDAAQAQETWRIRHEVYCRDLGWEPLREDGMETDEYDRHSVACLMRAVQSGASVGCLRLVLCRPEAPDYPLPLERLCAGKLDPGRFDIAALDRHRIAEVSRLAVMRDYRRRKGEADKPFGLDHSDFGEEGRQRFPFIPVGLYLGALAVADCLGLEHLLVLTEPRLARHLDRIGLVIRQIGEPVEHRGLRIPSVMDTAATIANLHQPLKDMWLQVHNDIGQGFRAAGPGALPWRQVSLP